jgi:PPOX class probable F420-dependent enzyme
LAACAGGDLNALLTLLADDVVVWTDGGGKAKAAPKAVTGAAKAARFLIAIARGTPEGAEVIEANLNGQPGLLALHGGSAVSAVVLDVAEGRVSGVRGGRQPRQAQRRERGVGRAPRAKDLDAKTGGPQVTKAGNKELTGYFAALSASNYMLLTTFRRDGRAVATPVHVVAEADRAFFRTWDVSGKAKRLRHTATVEVAPCSSRGRSRGPAVRAKVVLLAAKRASLMRRFSARKASLPVFPSATLRS